jgi:hypothetical protein
MNKKFQKRTEDFVCEKCGREVKGGGYTNHCPVCLWSKHVDIYPGDRQALCGGPMQPISVELRGGEYSITHMCVRCGHTKKNKASPDDDFDAVVALSKYKD